MKTTSNILENYSKESNFIPPTTTDQLVNYASNNTESQIVYYIAYHRLISTHRQINKRVTNKQMWINNIIQKYLYITCPSFKLTSPVNKTESIPIMSRYSCPILTWAA